MKNTIKVAILGANGRMGRTLCAVVQKDVALHLSYAIVRDSANLSSPFTDNLAKAIQNANILIDFTTPQLTAQAAKLCSSHGTAYIVGTTGLSSKQKKSLQEAGDTIPIVYAPNFSLGINILLNFAQKLGSLLSAQDFDVEITEMHHNKKIDCPSGTALALGEAIATGRNVDFDTVKRDERSGKVGRRPPGEIGLAAIRGGNVVGEHTAMFLGADESIVLKHEAHNRKVFARGAVFAGKWAMKQDPGLYSMRNILA